MSGTDPEAERGPAQPEEPGRAFEDREVPGEQETQETQEKADKALSTARDAVARAEATLHDQILSPSQGEDVEDEDHLDRRNTRGAWPNWTGKK